MIYLHFFSFLFSHQSCIKCLFLMRWLLLDICHYQWLTSYGNASADTFLFCIMTSTPSCFMSDPSCPYQPFTPPNTHKPTQTQSHTHPSYENPHAYALGLFYLSTSLTTTLFTDTIPQPQPLGSSSRQAN